MVSRIVSATSIAMAVLAGLGGCATTPPDQWVCDAEGPCYRIAQPAYHPYAAYPAYGWFGVGGLFWSRPYYYGAPAQSTAPSPAAPADATRGITPPRPSRGTTPGRSQPLGKRR